MQSKYWPMMCTVALYRLNECVNHAGKKLKSTMTGENDYFILFTISLCQSYGNT